MVLGIGIDLVEVRQIRRAVARDRGFLPEILTETEIKRCRRSSSFLPSSATTFAAKEALFKALGTGKRGKMSWHDIEVTHRPPGVVLSGATKKRAEELGVSGIHVAVTSKNERAAAVVVLEDSK
ncbi:MAG: holo-ACP synthase [Pseudomonadota bacterium]